MRWKITIIFQNTKFLKHVTKTTFQCWFLATLTDLHACVNKTVLPQRNFSRSTDFLFYFKCHSVLTTEGLAELPPLWLSNRRDFLSAGFKCEGQMLKPPLSLQTPPHTQSGKVSRKMVGGGERCNRGKVASSFLHPLLIAYQ